MEKIQFDTGVRAYRLGQGILRFNPGDPNLYLRFQQAAQQLQTMEEALEKENEDPMERLTRMDKQLKELLDWVFGPGTDFEKLLGGMNLLAVAENGVSVLSNLLGALEPVLVEGAKACARAGARMAVEKAKARREEG